MKDLTFLKENLELSEQDRWRKINEEYLTQLNCVNGDFFGLPVDIEFDSNETYKLTNTPLSLYFRNSYLKEEKWLPIEVENPDKFIFDPQCLDITLSDYYVIREYVVQHNNLIKTICENKINAHKFLSLCNKVSNAYKMPLNEMAMLQKEISGAPEKIWIDCGSSFKKGGHWIRIKVGNKDLATLTIPDYKWIGGENISHENKKLVEKFVKINIELITQVTLGQITFYEFLANLIKIDSKGLPIKQIKIKEWVPFIRFGNVEIFKKNGLPEKYLVCKLGKTESLFKKDDGQTILFDTVTYLGKNIDKCFCTIGEQSYWLTSNGYLEEIEFKNR